jgi:phosphate transport system protein
MATQRHFDEELAQLSGMITTMGGHAEGALRLAFQAVTERKDELAQEVEKNDNIIDWFEKEIDGVAVNLLSKAPLASDLRLVAVAMKISQNLERVGDEATTIARRARELNGEPLLERGLDIPRMAELALGMLHEALEAFAQRKPEKARAIIPRDKEVDWLHRQTQKGFIGYMEQNPLAIPRCLNWLTIAKSLERAGDHASNIAEEVVYICEALDLRHKQNLK